MVHSPSMQQSRLPKAKESLPALPPKTKESSLQSTLRESRTEMTVSAPAPAAFVPNPKRSLSRLRHASHLAATAASQTEELARLAQERQANAERDAKLKAALEGARSRASASLTKRDWQRSMAALNEAIAMRSSFDAAFGERACASYFAQLHANRSFVFCKLKKLGKGLEDADAAIGLDPTSSRGFHLRGRILLAVERYGEAATAFGAGLLSSPTDLQCSQGLEEAMALIRRQRLYTPSAPALETTSTHTVRSLEKDASSATLMASPRKSAAKEASCAMDALFLSLDEDVRALAVQTRMPQANQAIICVTLCDCLLGRVMVGLRPRRSRNSCDCGDTLIQLLQRFATFSILMEME